MISSRRGAKLQSLYPQAYETIKSTISGQFETEQGLFTFNTLFPLKTGLKSTVGSSQPFGGSQSVLNEEEYYWKLISVIPNQKLKMLTTGIRTLFFYMTPVALLIFAGLSWFWAIYLERKREYSQHVEELAHIDGLTKLANRISFFEKLDVAMDEAARLHLPVYLFFIDLDGFKKVNDTFSHEAGDYVLKEVGKRLNRLVRKIDVVARLGGDEFVILIKFQKDKNNIENIADRVIKAISSDMLYEDKVISIGCSIGISCYPEDGDNTKSLIAAADEAMYLVKNNHKNDYCFYQDIKNRHV